MRGCGTLPAHHHREALRPLPECARGAPLALAAALAKQRRCLARPGGGQPPRAFIPPHMWLAGWAAMCRLGRAQTAGRPVEGMRACQGQRCCQLVVLMTAATHVGPRGSMGPPPAPPERPWARTHALDASWTVLPPPLLPVLTLARALYRHTVALGPAQVPDPRPNSLLLLAAALFT